MISIDIGPDRPTIPRPGSRLTEGPVLIRTDGGDQTIISGISGSREDQIGPGAAQILDQLAAAPAVTDAEALHALHS